MTIFQKSGLYKVIPNLKNEIESYEKIILSSTNQLLWFDYIQRFEMQFYTGIKRDYYTLIWGIKKKYEPTQKIVQVSNGDKQIFCDPKLLDFQKVNFYANKKIDNPIIIAKCLPTMNDIVIDGNHRFHASIKRGYKYINAIILSPSTHINYMLTDRMKTIYKIHHNLFVLRNLCTYPYFNFGYKSNQSLEIKTFYDFDNPIIFTNLDNIKLIFKKYFAKNGISQHGFVASGG